MTYLGIKCYGICRTVENNLVWSFRKAQGVKLIAAIVEDLIPIPSAHMVEGKKTCSKDIL